MIPIAIASFSNRELSLKRTIFKEVIQLIALEACLIVFGFGRHALEAGNMSLVIGFAISVLVVYVFVMLIMWFLDYRQARKMTDELIAFQMKNKR